MLNELFIEGHQVMVTSEVIQLLANGIIYAFSVLQHTVPDFYRLVLLSENYHPLE